jgi:hypothetical protein
MLVSWEKKGSPRENPEYSGQVNRGPRASGETLGWLHLTRTRKAMLWLWGNAWALISKGRWPEAWRWVCRPFYDVAVLFRLQRQPLTRCYVDRARGGS